MKIRDNMVVKISYVYLSEKSENLSSPYKLEFITGKNMVPREIETALYDREEGEEVFVSLQNHNNTNDIYFLPFERIPSGIEMGKGVPISILKADGTTEIIVIDEVLPDGIIGRKVLGNVESSTLKIKIESVRWATLTEFQEGRVIEA